MQTLQQFRTYFNTFLKHPEINAVFVGSIDGFLDKIETISRKNCPLLFVNYPYRQGIEMNTAESEHENLSITIGLYNTPLMNKKSDETKFNEIFEQLHPVISDVKAKIRHDFQEEEELFEVGHWMSKKIKGPNESYPITKKRMVGWSLEIELGFEERHPYNSTLWQ
ncbi:hypothetical protein [Flammeovirga pacifica]|uniref:Uncharacterized protein n=1 Tax=Flammeovirga pacifica TaxID=915059 RepID=A0A1S1Z276_FLAPC|nr:hypothetical protein [Flammeovirga pacifica]OHX67379.1 hypothetical protein NH26_14010 [Flammeovirga pacifica]